MLAKKKAIKTKDKKLANQELSLSNFEAKHS